LDNWRKCPNRTGRLDRRQTAEFATTRSEVAESETTRLRQRFLRHQNGLFSASKHSGEATMTKIFLTLAAVLLIAVPANAGIIVKSLGSYSLAGSDNGPPTSFAGSFNVPTSGIVTGFSIAFTAPGEDNMIGSSTAKDFYFELIAPDTSIFSIGGLDPPLQGANVWTFTPINGTTVTYNDSFLFGTEGSGNWSWTVANGREDAVFVTYSDITLTLNQLESSAVPEPSVLGLFAIGAIGFWCSRRRKRGHSTSSDVSGDSAQPAIDPLR
jgi:hypothetical protein